MKFIFFSFFFIILIIPNIIAFNIIDSKDIIFDQEINLNYFDFNLNNKYSKIDLEVKNFDTNKIYFLKNINVFDQNKNKFSFSKLYNSKLLFKYKFYDIENNFILEKNYQINLISSSKEYVLFFCNTFDKENCLIQNKFNINESVYLFSSNPNVFKYNVIIYDSNNNVYSKHDFIELPFKLKFNSVGVYIINSESNNISKTNYLEITDKNLNNNYLEESNFLDEDDFLNDELFEPKSDLDNNFFKKNNFFYFKFSIFIFILILIIFLILKTSNKSKPRPKRRLERKKITIFIIFFIFFIFLSTSIFSESIEYKNLEISYEDLQEKFQYPKEVSLFIFSNAQVQNKYVPIIDFEDFDLNILKNTFDFTINDLSDDSNLNLNINLEDVYLIVNKELQDKLNLIHPKLQLECYDVINFFNSNPIVSEVDLVNRIYSNLIKKNNFSKDCISNLVNAGYLYPKKLISSFEYSDNSFDYNKTKSYDLKFNIAKMFWNPDNKIIKLNLIYTDTLSIKKYSINKNINKDIVFNIYNNSLNQNFNQEEFQKQKNYLKIEEDNSLFLNKYIHFKDLNYFEFKLINDEVIKFDTNHLKFINIFENSSNFFLKSISEAFKSDNSNKYLINYYLISKELSNQDNFYFFKNKNKLKIKNKLNKITFYNKEEGLFVKSKKEYHKLSPEKFNSNIYYYYEIYPEFIDFYLINDYKDNIVVYNDIYSYTSFNYIFDMGFDSDLISISSNEYGSSFIYENDNYLNLNFEPNNIIDSNLSLEKIINTQYKYFVDSNFENLEKAVSISTDVANAFDLNIEETNMFVAYYLSKIKNSFDKTSKVQEYFCKDESVNKYEVYFDKVNFNYFKFNSNDALNVDYQNLFYIENFPFTDVNYNNLCNYLDVKQEKDIIDYTIGIFIGFEFFKELNNKNNNLNLIEINNKYLLNLEDKELYYFISNYLLFNNFIKNNNYAYFLELKDIYQKSFLNFKIPISKYTKVELNKIVNSKFIKNKYYLGNCAILSVNSLNHLFNFSTGYNPADAWYLVGNNNVSIWRKYEDEPLNVDHLIPGLILGIDTGRNYYNYNNFVSPRIYNLPKYYLNKGFYSYNGNTIKVPYTHVVPYIGDFGLKKNVVLSAGANQISALSLNEYVPSGAEEGSWINRSIIEVLAPANYYSEQEINKLKEYLTSFD